MGAILPHASIPGYILFISVISFLPAFMLEMAIFSQFFGQPAISFALLMITCATTAQGWKGYKMTTADNKTSIKKRLKQAGETTKKAYLLAAAMLLLWTIYMAWSFWSGNPNVQ